MPNDTAALVRTASVTGIACLVAVVAHYAIWIGWQSEARGGPNPSQLAAAGGLALLACLAMAYRAWQTRRIESPLDVVAPTSGLVQMCIALALLVEAAMLLVWAAGVPIDSHLAAILLAAGVLVAPVLLPILFPAQAAKDHPWRQALEESRLEVQAMRAKPAASGGQPAPSARPAFLREVANPGAAYADVVGLEAAKQDVAEAIRLMETPQLGQAHGIEPVRGVLLHGPPGTGKTYFARATAGQFDKRFLEVRSSDLVSQYVGETEKNIAAAFAYARSVAPAILFIDEIDGLARDRSLARNDWEVSRVNALLTEMDGITKDPKAPIVIAATNRIDDLDPAILRPGRFDRKVLVGLPAATDRSRMLRQMLKGSRLAAGFDSKWLVARTHGMSPADLKALVQDVRRTIFREGGATPRAIEMADFQAALANASMVAPAQ